MEARIWPDSSALFEERCFAVLLGTEPFVAKLLLRNNRPKAGRVLWNTPTGWSQVRTLPELLASNGYE